MSKEIKFGGWRPFPEELPPEAGKYIVLLDCDGRQWTSIKPWGRTQIHTPDGFVGHRMEPKVWFLGMEFSETKVCGWKEIN